MCIMVSSLQDHYDPNGPVILRVSYDLMTLWIWIGGVLVALGGALGVLAGLTRRRGG